MKAILNKTLPFGEPQMKIVEVNPEVARDWLERNIGNRPVSMAAVNRYAKDMLDGRWKLTGDPIRFSTTGKLIDGQHRLSAILKAGVAIKCVVITELEDSIFNVIDTGRGRGRSDILFIEYGLPIATTKLLATAAVLAFLYEKQVFSFKGKVGNDELSAYVRERPRLLTAATYVSDHVPHESPAPKSIAAAFYYFASELDEPRAQIFLERFMVGAVLDANDNLLHLRNSLFSARAARRPVQTPDIFGRLIRIWNAERRGKPIKHYGNVALRDGDPYPQFI